MKKKTKKDDGLRKRVYTIEGGIAVLEARISAQEESVKMLIVGIESLNRSALLISTKLDQVANTIGALKSLEGGGDNLDPEAVRTAMRKIISSMENTLEEKEDTSSHD